MLKTLFLKNHFFRANRFLFPYVNFSEGKSSFLKMMEEEEKKTANTNPFFNERAAGIKKNIDSMSHSLKDWQENFKKKHNRRPTLEDMQNDPSISGLISLMKSEKNLLKSTIQRFRIN